MTTSFRVDKWLWSVRLFKTRSLAAKACNAGKVKRNDQTLKPATEIRTGDYLDVPDHENLYKKKIKVLSILTTRVNASLAQQAYEDQTPQKIIEESKKRKEEISESRKLRKYGDQGRITKKQRRAWEKGLHSFKSKSDKLIE